MASHEEVEFIAQIKTQFKEAKFTDGIQSFTFCRAKFECHSRNGYKYNMFLRIVDVGEGYLNINLDYPKSTKLIRSNHDFFHKLKKRIEDLCPPMEENPEPKEPKFRTSLPNQFE